MGANYSEQLVESVTNITNQALTEVNTKIKNSHSTELINQQRIRINLKNADISSCNVVAKTFTNIDLQSMAQFTNEISQELRAIRSCDPQARPNP